MRSHFAELLQVNVVTPVYIDHLEGHLKVSPCLCGRTERVSRMKGVVETYM